MLNIKKKILDFVSLKEDPVKLKSIMKNLGLGGSDRQYVKSLLTELVKEGAVTKIGNQFWVPDGKQQSLDIKRTKTRMRDTLSGRMCLTSRGFGFVENPKGDDWFVPERALAGARHGDQVLARKVSRDANNRISAEVIEIESFGKTLMTGVFEVEGHFQKFTPFGPVTLERREMIGFPQDATDGQVGLWERSESGKWHFQKMLGHLDDPMVDEEIVLVEAGIPRVFPPEVLAAGEDVGRHFQFELGDRTDFRDRLVFTVDGADARDFDDALHFRELPDGHIEVGIHIADVSPFVKEDGLLDRCAQERGNSVYLPHKAIPMLPSILSSDLCSLRPDEDRYTLSVVAIMDRDAQLKSYTLHKGLIRSSFRLTYSQVAKACLDKDAELREELKEVVPSLDLSIALARAMHKQRRAKGGLVIDIPEVVVKLDEGHKLESVSLYRQTDANRMIEAFMVLANEIVARHMEERGIGIPYRIHEQPDMDRIEDLVTFLKGFGIEPPMELGTQTGVALNKIIKALQNKPGARVLQTQVLKSLKLAEYNIDNRGHFGLASTSYAHFTSPIRRYADLIVHRRLTRLLKKSDLGPEHFDDGRLMEDCEHISTTEREAMTAEKSFRRIKILRHIREHEMGNEFHGIIEEVKNFGLMVRLDDLYISGLVHVEEFRDDYYVYNPENLSLIGRNKGRVYQVGDEIQVQILLVDFIARRLDLAPTENQPPQRKVPQRSGQKRVKRTLSQKLSRGPRGGDARPGPRSRRGGGKKGGRGGGRRG
ncbi:MAG: ribonuclease R [Acidobacteriota bacterium]|nr:ribonuclease R [Acidobacteriota bacterium]